MAAPQFPVESPMWWVYRLHTRLIEQAKSFAVFDDYYCGNHPLPWLAEQAQDDFRRILKMTRSNYMGLVVDAMVERMTVEGFRVAGEVDADADMWRIWQANRLDGYFDQALLESAIGGQSFMLVAPNAADVKTPHVWVEHPTQAIVAYEPGTNRRVRAAGLKLWRDDWTGRLCATLYLPESIHKFESEGTSSTAVASDKIRWRPRVVIGEEWPAGNPLGVVPLHEIANNPRLLSGGVSEIHDVIDVQDRINKTVADRLMTQDFGAFPQKWSSGWPETDGNGQPSRKINVGRDRMVTTDVAETKFGQWDAAPLDPYSAAKREDVKDVASRTRTPAQYLLGEMSNVNGETLKASESGLVSKVRQRGRTTGEDLEDVQQTVRRAAGLPPAVSIETIWKNPEFRTEGELVDGLVKMSTLGVPYEALWERWGASVTEMNRWRELAAQQDGVLERVTRPVAEIGAGNADTGHGG